MKRLLFQISLSVFLFSLLSYCIGRTLLRDVVTDDVGDLFLWSGGISLIVLLFSKTVHIQFGIRREINIIVICIVLFLAVFRVWGLFTVRGRREYPELAGLFPFYSLLAGGILLAILLAINIIWKSSDNRSK